MPQYTIATAITVGIALMVYRELCTLQLCNSCLNKTNKKMTVQFYLSFFTFRVAEVILITTSNPLGDDYQ